MMDQEDAHQMAMRTHLKAIIWEYIMHFGPIEGTEYALTAVHEVLDEVREEVANS